MSGLFVAIVGPSGAGKDSLIRGFARRAAGDSRFAIVRRVVTRSGDAHEDHDTLDPASFAARARAGGFALSWEAHNLSYGVPIEVDRALASGQTLLCNLSRGAAPEARRRWPNVLVVLVTARPETLAARLAARGREPPGDRRSRLERAVLVDVAADATIENDGDIDAAVDRLFALLSEHRRFSP